jgi:predicted transcriptional regulator
MAAFSAGNLVSVATMLRNEIRDANARIWRREDREEARSSQKDVWQLPRKTVHNPKLIIAADDDWQTKDNPGLFHGFDAARAAHGVIAIPNFGKDREQGQTDFNDLAAAFKGDGHEYVKEDIEAAVEPNQLLKKVLLDNPYSAHGEALVKQLLQVKEQDREHYEKLLAELKAKGVRAGEVDRAIKAESKRAAASQAADLRRAEPVEVDVVKLAKSAEAILASKNVPELFAKDCSRVIAGEESLAKLIYLAATSRLLDESMHIAVKGPSAVGKSKTRKAVLEFFPPESVISFTAVTEKALLYVKGDFAHKVLSMGEASNRKETELQDYLLRELMSEGKLRYMVPVKVGNDIETITIEKNGPVAFIVTTTRNSLHQENETRMLSLEADDSAKQTKNVLRQVATAEGLNRQPVQADYAPWHDFQRLLEAGERRVAIAWAPTLTELIETTKSVRLRRDFKQLLLAIKAHALLHRDHRKRNGRGEIAATIKSDYATVYELMKDLLASAAEVKARKTLVETVAAINAVFAAEPRRDNVTVQQVAEKLGVDRTATYRRLQAAQTAGYVVNNEKRERHPGLYQVVEQPSEASELLPSPEALLRKWNEECAARSSRFGTPLNPAATQQQAR